MTIIWCMVPEIWSVTNRIFCHFGLFFVLNNPKNQNFEKMKKKPGDIITLHMCTINDNHIRHGSWDIKHNGQNFWSFWTIFWLFTPITTQKIKILKKWKKIGEINILHKCTKKSWSYATLFLRYGAWQMYLFFIFGHFFHFYPPNSPKNQNFKKMKKAPGNIIILHQCTKNYDHMLFCSWDI